MFDGEQNGGKWGDLGKGGKRSEMMVGRGVITERKDTEWGRQLWQNGRLLAGLIKKQEKAKGSQSFPFAVHICRQCRQNKGFSGGG